ncbi:MAG: FAD-dependent oxidoreductase [Acidimicrobiales bacterium]
MERPPADAVLWQEQVTWPDVASRPLPDRVHTVVVGAGYAGLAAARTLARAGRSVLVVEKGQLGWGAHSRNGGMAIPELKAGPATLVRRYGELGRRMHAEVNEAFDHLESLIAAESIDCDYARTGQLYLAHSPRVVDHLRALADEHAAAGSRAVRAPRRAAPRDRLRRLPRRRGLRPHRRPPPRQAPRRPGPAGRRRRRAGRGRCAARDSTTWATHWVHTERGCWRPTTSSSPRTPMPTACSPSWPAGWCPSGRSSWPPSRSPTTWSTP